MSKGLAEGFLTFVLYALGMGAPLILTTILLAQAKEYVVNRIKRVAPWLQKFSGVVLIVVGFYLFYFYYTTYM
jgi:cytochrome c biogenesis protein CcdA